MLLVHATIIMCHRRAISLKRRWWSRSSVGVRVIMLLRVRESVLWLMSIRMYRAIGNQFCMSIINFIFLIAFYVLRIYIKYAHLKLGVGACFWGWMIDLWLCEWSTTYDDSLKEFAAETTMMSTTTRFALASSQRMSFRNHNTYNENGSSRSSNDNLSRNSNRHSFSGFQQHMTTTQQQQQQQQQLRNNSRRSSLIYGKVQNPLSSINVGFP